MIESTEALDAGTVDAEAVFADIVSRLSGLQWNPQMTGPQAFGAMKQVLLLRNLVDHHATTLTGEMDRLGVADHKTTRLRELLISMGFAPAVASRYVRFAGTTDVDLLLAHAADGSISSEHADAIVRGLAHIDTRCPEPMDTVQRCEYLRKLLSHYFAGFTPAEINLYARQLGNELAAETPGGLPAAEDKSINSYTDRITDDGRLEISANLDIIAGEKTRTLMETLSTPKPQPRRIPGSADTRTNLRRRIRNDRGVGSTRPGRHHLLSQTHQRPVVDLVSGQPGTRRELAEHGRHHRSHRENAVVRHHDHQDHPRSQRCTTQCW